MSQTRAEGGGEMSASGIDFDDPRLAFRVDGFLVPDTARQEFDAAMRTNVAFIETLQGFRGHVVFEKTGGPTTFNVVTIAAWESAEALECAGAEVRAHYEKIGFDLAAVLERWGAKAEVGTFQVRSAEP